MRRVLTYALTTAASLAFASAALGGTITGQVFRDYNSNAVKNPGATGSSVAATDTGMTGVTVRAYDNAGNKVGEATTAANGTYSLSVTGTGTVRVEFETPSGFKSSFEGQQSGTSVQFVDAAGASNVNYAVNVPGEYCQDNPDLVTCIERGGDLVLNGSTNPGAFKFPSGFLSNPLVSDGGGQKVNADNQIGNNGGDTWAILAPFDDIGSTFGVGTDRQGNAYFGTYVKRHAPYGPAGAVNAVYKVNRASGAASTFVTLGSATLPAHVQASPPDWAPNSYATDGLRIDNNPNDVFHSVGRAGLGDVDVTPEGDTLYAVEMTESAPKLWAVPINGAGANTTAGTPTSVAIPRPSSINGALCRGTWHPMGIGIRGDLYLVGGVCGADNQPTLAISAWSITSNVATITTASAHNLAVGDVVNIGIQSAGVIPAGASYTRVVTEVPNATQFKYATASGTANGSGTPVLGTAVSTPVGTAAFVQRFDPATSTFTTVAGVSLAPDTYGKAINQNNGSSSNDLTQQSWSSSLGEPGRDGNANSTSWYDGTYPRKFDGEPVQYTGVQAMVMLANIEITDGGDLVLAFRDRGNDQVKSGEVSYEAPAQPTLNNDLTRVRASSAEILRLCAQVGGGYLPEHQGACGNNVGSPIGDLMSDTGTRGSGLPSSYAMKTNFTAPQFYATFYRPFSTTNPGAGHAYTTLGGTATMPGVRQLWSTVYDPDAYVTQGVRGWGDCSNPGDPVETSSGIDLYACGPTGNSDGAINGVLNVGWGIRGGGSPGGGFGKGNGMGDLEVACDSAPLQIGNRVWIDTNRNGIQDPDEPVGAGVTVHLYDAQGNRVGTAITDNSGDYYFASNVTQANPNLPVGGSGNLGAGLKPGEAFTIRFDNPDDFAAGGPLEGLAPTAQDATSSTPDVMSNAVNSKAAFADGYSTIAVAPRKSGYNDHTFDAGFVTPRYGMGDYTWIDLNKNGIQDPAEPPLAGVQVQLLNPDGTVATDADGNPVAPATTDADGYYFIGNLLAGNYKAQFTLPNGSPYRFTVANAGSPGTDSTPQPTQNPLVGLTGQFTIAATATGTTTAVNKPNANFANLTIDAGVVSTADPVGMGDYTWIDSNRNGIQDPGEPPLPGVKVELLNPDGSQATDFTGTPVAPVFTDTRGYYLITNLRPGDYRARFTIPSGYAFTKAGAGVPGTDSNPDSFSANGLVGTTPVFTIAGSVTGNTTAFTGNPKALFANLTIDAGVVPLVAIGNFVWFDKNRDGVQGRNEKPVKGAKVYLLNPDGTRAKDASGKPVKVATTDAKGRYLFQGLLPGDYRVKFVFPKGYSGTIAGKGGAKNGSNPKVSPLTPRVGLTSTFRVFDSARGNTVRQLDPKVNAKFIDPTIDAGLILYGGGPQGVVG